MMPKGIYGERDVANRPNGLTGTLAGVPTNYIGNFNYWPHGAPYYYTYGNGLWHAQDFNPQLQVLEAYDALNNMNDAAHMLLALCPNWGASNATGSLYQLCSPTSGNTDNGTLRGMQIGLGNGTGFAQSYTAAIIPRQL